MIKKPTNISCHWVMKVIKNNHKIKKIKKKVLSKLILLLLNKATLLLMVIKKKIVLQNLILHMKSDLMGKKELKERRRIRIKKIIKKAKKIALKILAILKELNKKEKSLILMIY